ncbi:MAG: hypothetical protein IPI91_04540 [Flavobacteriales bacterium]|nr:hypothetical protein [Flavobacteriales bacterium]
MQCGNMVFCALSLHDAGSNATNGNGRKHRKPDPFGSFRIGWNSSGGINTLQIQRMDRTNAPKLNVPQHKVKEREKALDETRR